MRREVRWMPLVAAALVLAATAVPARGQDAGALEDGQWLPYLGCWVDVTDLEGPMTCVVPEGAGVAMLTVQGSEVTSRRAVVADGRERPAEVAGCTGTESAGFSADGHRLYTRSSLTCGAADRETRGLMAAVGATQWIEVRTLGGEDGVAWMKRYRPAPQTRVETAGLAERLASVASPEALEIARAAASRRIAVEDIIEANGRAGSAAVQAWIAEHGQPLRIDADRLVQLADAGVPPAVIDVVVAVSFPDRFAVARAGDYGQAGDYGRDGYGAWGAWGAWSPFSPFYYDPYYYRYGRYSSYYGLGYYDYGWYGPGYRPTVVVVSPSVPQARPGGQLVKGQGYTRGTSGGTAARPSIRPTGSSGAQIGSGSSSSKGSSKGKAKRRGSGGGN